MPSRTPQAPSPYCSEVSPTIAKTKKGRVEGDKRRSTQRRDGVGTKSGVGRRRVDTPESVRGIVETRARGQDTLPLRAKVGESQRTPLGATGATRRGCVTPRVSSETPPPQERGRKKPVLVLGGVRGGGESRGGRCTRCGLTEA